MLHELLSSVNIAPKRCAAVLGISPDVFAEWASGQKPIPAAYVSYLASVLGVPSSTILERKRTHEDVTPAIWYKFRGASVTEADREYVLLIRQLGFFLNELEAATQRRAVGWSTLFPEIRRKTNKQAAPRDQGREAARMFRESTGLEKGSTSIGEVFRGALRQFGVLVIESPVPDSNMEGCSFYVGGPGDERPCVFANSHRSTWFRRNMVLMHEVAHAIFDAESEGASLDFIAQVGGDSIPEQRASAFAQEALLPREVLKHISIKRGIDWTQLTDASVAQLVADCEVEQRLVLQAARDAGLWPQDSERLIFDIAEILPRLTDRALSTPEYIKKLGRDANPWLEKRMTTTTARPLRLPSKYVESVVTALSDGQISRGKAARMLMLDENELAERFQIAEEHELD